LQVTSRPAAAQHLRDLARLRWVRDRIDREYAQPLDVEALARGAHMSAGHLSREFRLAYGESPYRYLMTRRIERAMALLGRGDLSVTEVCFAVGCSSLGTFSTRFTELVGMTQHLPAPGCAHHSGDAVVHGETGDQTDQKSRSAGHRATPKRDRHGHHHSRELPAAQRPGRLPGLLPRHPRLRGPQRRRIRRDATEQPYGVRDCAVRDPAGNLIRINELR
jgi:AraC-like DNA-binding protein